MIDEDSSAGRLPAQHRLLAGIDLHEGGAAKGACRGMEVNGVQHGIGRRIDERHFDLVPLMHHHERPGNRTIVGERGDCRTGVINDGGFFYGRQFECDDLWPALRDLLVPMNEGRRSERHFFAGKLGISLRASWS